MLWKNFPLLRYLLFIERNLRGTMEEAEQETGFLNWNFTKRHFFCQVLCFCSLHPCLKKKKNHLVHQSSPSLWIYALIYSQGSANCISHTLARGFKAEICMRFPQVADGAVASRYLRRWQGSLMGGEEVEIHKHRHVLCACWGFVNNWMERAGRQHTARVRDVITLSP